jgi:hypothetical protein
LRRNDWFDIRVSVMNAGMLATTRIATDSGERRASRNA